MKFRIHFITFLLLTLINMPAYSGAYFGAEGGLSWHSFDSGNARDYLERISGSNVSVKDDSYMASWRIFLGNHINDWLSFELGMFAGNDYKAKFKADDVGLKSYIDYKGADLSFLIRPVKQTQFDGLFLKLRMHYSQLSGATKGTINYSYLDSGGSNSGTGALVGVGYQFDLNNEWKLRTSYTYMDAFAGENSENFDNFHIGLSYDF